MRITQLHAENVLALKAIDIQIPDGQNIVEISGANGAGKSSCLASIMWALCGGNEIPEKPVHEGADEAVAEVVLDGKFRVKRTIKPDRKSRLEITGADGVKSTSGQKLLNDLLDIRTIDPMRFARLGETADGLKEQREVLLSMLQLPFDLKAERAKYAGLYELRREKKRELDGIEKLMKSVERPTVDVNGSKEISGVAVAERLAAAEREVAANTAIRQAAARAQAATESIVMDRNRLAFREGIDNSALLNHQRIVDEAGVELAKMPDVEQEILKLTANIQTLEETLADLRVKLSTASKARQTREVVKGRIERGLIMVENDKATLTATRTELAELSADVEKAKAIEAEAHVKADALVDPNLDTIRAELKAVEIRNGHIRKAAEFRKTERIFLDKQAEVDAIQGDMDAIKAKVDAAKAKYAQSVISKDNLADQVAVDVRQGCLDLVESAAIIKSQEDNLQDAAEALKISYVRFNNGVGINLDVIDAQVSLANVQKNLAEGIYDYIMANARLDRLMGRAFLKEENLK